MQKSLLCGLLVLSLAIAPMAFSQTVDLVFDLNDLDTNTKSVAAAEDFTAYLVVKDAAAMTGVSVDITFDATDGMELMSIQEVSGDLNFSGDLDLNNEILPILNQFVDEFNFVASDNTNFTDGYGRKSAIVYDTNADTLTGLNELLAAINEFTAEFNFAGTNYWTRAVLFTSSFDESVEIFDPVEKSNVGGDNPGVIDDVTVVLLKRPDRTEAFGFTGDAVVATLNFKAKAAGTYQMGFPQAKFIDSGFTDLSDVQDLSVPATLPTVTVQ